MIGFNITIWQYILPVVTPPVPDAMLLEDGTDMLLEDGTNMLLES